MTAQLRSVLASGSVPSRMLIRMTRRPVGCWANWGHDVTRAASPDHALELINSDHTDLLVMDVSNSANREMFESLIELPEPNGRTRLPF